MYPYGVLLITTEYFVLLLKYHYFAISTIIRGPEYDVRISNGYMGGPGGALSPGLLWGYRQALRCPRTSEVGGYA
jgi:hypothetical protein